MLHKPIPLKPKRAYIHKDALGNIIAEVRIKYAQWLIRRGLIESEIDDFDKFLEKQDNE